MKLKDNTNKLFKKKKKQFSKTSNTFAITITNKLHQT